MHHPFHSPCSLHYRFSTSSTNSFDRYEGKLSTGARPSCFTRRGRKTTWHTSSSAGLSRQYLLDWILSTSWNPWSNQKMCYVAGRRFNLDAAITEQPELHSGGDLSRLRLGGVEYRRYVQSNHALRPARELHNLHGYVFRGG